MSEIDKGDGWTPRIVNLFMGIPAEVWSDPGQPLFSPVSGQELTFTEIRVGIAMMLDRLNAAQAG